MHIIYIFVLNDHTLKLFFYTPDEILLSSCNSGSLSFIQNANIASFVTKPKILTVL